jgi:hypothetical protein
MFDGDGVDHGLGTRPEFFNVKIEHNGSTQSLTRVVNTDHLWQAAVFLFQKRDQVARPIFHEIK